MVHPGMAGVVVHLDVVHVSCLLDAWDLPHVAAVSEDVWQLSNSASVTLEVNSVHLIVTDQSLEEANVRKSELVTSEELSRGEMLV